MASPVLSRDAAWAAAHRTRLGATDHAALVDAPENADGTGSGRDPPIMHALARTDELLPSLRAARFGPQHTRSTAKCRPCVQSRGFDDRTPIQTFK